MEEGIWAPFAVIQQFGSNRRVHQHALLGDLPLAAQLRDHLGSPGDHRSGGCGPLVQGLGCSGLDTLD